MRRVTALVLAGLLCLSLCACGDEGVTEIPEQTPTQEVVQPVEKGFSLAYDPTADLHPITGDSRVNQLLTSLIYEGLYELDECFSPQPVLARSAAVDDSGLVWTITLREGVVFSDGTPLEAAHVVSSLKTAKKSTLYSGRLSHVASVRAVDGAVVITLTEPNSRFLSLLDIPVVLETEEEPPLGTGRYRYARDGESLYLLANYNRDGTLPYAAITLCPVTAADERVAAFDSGAVSAVTADFSSPYELGYSCSYEVWDYATTDLLYVGFKVTDGPCQSNLVRQAFAKAFDRVSIAGEQLNGHAEPAALPVHPLGEDWVAEAAAALGYDPTEAAELLVQAGYTLNEADGLLYQKRTALSVTLLVNSENSVKCAIADMLAAELQTLGVTVTVNKLVWKDYLTALKKGEFDLYLGEVRLTADFDVTELLSGSLNYGGYDAAPLTELLTNREIYSGEAGEWMNRLLWNAFAEEVPFAPLCFKRESLLVRWDTVSGLAPTRSDPFRNMENWVPATE